MTTSSTIYTLSETQFNTINAAFPTGHSFGHTIESGGYHFHSTDAAFYEFDLDALFQTIYTMDFQEFLDTLAVFSFVRQICDFKIGDYADEELSCTPYNLFNFKTMLRREYSTNKNTTMMANGRPSTTHYTIDDVLVAIIYFSFVSDSDGLLTSRREELVYIDRDDNESERITIKYKSYDMSDTTHTDAFIVLNERKTSRNVVVETMKIIAGGVLMNNLSLTLLEVSDLVNPFWIAFAPERNSFIEIGSTALHTKITAIISLITPYQWIREEVTPGVTLKQYMINVLDAYYATP